MCCSSGKRARARPTANSASAERIVSPISAYRLTKRASATRVEPEEVVPDEHLTVAVEPGADADRRDRELAGDARCDGCRHRLEDEREAAGRLERAGVVEEPPAAFSAVRPCALKPPSIVADCGVRPRWPITGMPASTIALTRASIAPAPSSFTASAPASFTKRMAFPNRILVGDLEGAERHVRDHEWTLAPRG